MKKLSYIFILTVFLTACKKKSAVTIQAQNLLNEADGSDYAGMVYSVLERKTTYAGEESKLIKEGVLDENGHASFDIKMGSFKNYVVGIQKPDNICYTEVTIEEYLEHNKNNVINFNYAPCAYYDIRTNNINCEGDDDEFRFRFYYTDNPDIYIYRGFGNLNEWNEQVAIYGCQDYSNSDPYYRSIPSGNYTLEWEVRRPSGTTTGIDYFTVTEGDTTTYILEY
ncbi:MAG: hypothetical protein ACWA41_05080 [Putridiphycobacter sp.]